MAEGEHRNTLCEAEWLEGQDCKTGDSYLIAVLEKGHCYNGNKSGTNQEI